MRLAPVAFATSLLLGVLPAGADEDLEIPAAPTGAPTSTTPPSTPPPAPKLAPPPAPLPSAPPASTLPPASTEPAAPAGLVVSGYVQAEYQRSQASEDERAQGGARSTSTGSSSAAAACAPIARGASPLSPSSSTDRRPAGRSSACGAPRPR